MTAASERSDRKAPQVGEAVERRSLRVAAALLVLGEVVSFAAGMFHPDHQQPNNHPAVFVEYANSAIWTPVHLGQFLGMALVIAGLIVLVSALRLDAGVTGVLARLAGLGAAVALALYGVLQAADGVALKRAVDAWVIAPDAERTTRFANAETVRWLEEAVRSYQSFVFGGTLVLLGLLIVSARLPRIVGALALLSGVAYLIQGWILGVEGFAPANHIPTLAGYVLVIAWSVWLMVFSLQMKAELSADPSSDDFAAGRRTSPRPV